MRRPKKSDLFEQRIHRIHELLDGSGAEVTWNDRVPDPDNPGQPRQIDVAVKRAGALALIECRIHKRPQGVKWIEELMGRRTSLRAVGVIAVSSSGFSKGARLKAAKHQVELRTLQDLSDCEVLAWGRSVSLSLMCYQYSDVTLSLFLDGDSDVDAAAAGRELRTHPVWQTLFNQASEYLTSQGLITPENINNRVRFGIKLEPAADFHIAGRRVRLAELAGHASVLVLAVRCPVVEVYGSPAGAASAIVERFDLGETSIVHENERVGVFIDVQNMYYSARQLKGKLDFDALLQASVLDRRR